ncbi:MAG: 2Fe-2S iron-sulfur cluster-binding protein [Candidatus Aminicenantales bacterium]
MAKIHIDGITLEAEEGMTILQVAEQAGLQIPHLCYHEAFIPEGSCRMCLVEIEGLPKLELACSTRIRDGMKISTISEKVREARKGVLEFLLAEHPIDCPICDKAGECKLQDYYEEYGLFDSAYREYKERRSKKMDIGKGLILDQERCIQCTRCVRFLREVTQTGELGLFERGIHSEINVYNGNGVDNNYSGNLAQICPVGAITDRDFRFQTRTWFLESRPSICPLCSRGCSIWVDAHPGFSRFPVPKRVYRIRARENPDVNGFWICDRGRYGYSYINEERITNVRSQEPLRIRSWSEAMAFLGEKINRLILRRRPERIGVILNTWLTNEELFLARKLFQQDLGLEHIGIIDAPEAKADGILLTAERSPNRRGAQELGVPVEPPESAILPEQTELLLVFAPPLAEAGDLASLHALISLVSTSVYFGARNLDVSRACTITLPTAVIAEKSGTLTNVDGLRQTFSMALEPPGEARSEWSVLVELGKILKTDFRFYRRLKSPETIRFEMENIPMIEKNRD